MLFYKKKILANNSLQIFKFKIEHEILDFVIKTFTNDWWGGRIRDGNPRFTVFHLSIFCFQDSKLFFLKFFEHIHREHFEKYLSRKKIVNIRRLFQFCPLKNILHPKLPQKKMIL